MCGKAEFAAAVLRILREECGASTTDDTLDYQLERAIVEENPGWGVEFRFVGALGFGGKLHLHSRFFQHERSPVRDHRVYVTCYPEDSTPERDAMIAAANERLSALADEYDGLFRNVDYEPDFEAQAEARRGDDEYGRFEPWA